MAFEPQKIMVSWPKIYATLPFKKCAATLDFRLTIELTPAVVHATQWVALGLIPDSDSSRYGGMNRSRTESSRTGSFDTSQHVRYVAAAS